MAADKCSSSLLLDPYWFGGNRGPSVDLHAIETEALARALCVSMFPNPEAAPPAAAYGVDTTPSSSSMSSTFFPSSPSPTVSNASTAPASSSAGSPFRRSSPASPSPAPPLPRPQSGAIAAGRISKRKPRRTPSSSSKRSLVFIEADPARFMEMVQQMTGMGTSTLPPVPLPVTQHPLPVPMVQQMFHRTTTAPQIHLPSAVAPPPTLDTSEGFMDTFSLLQQNQQQILSAPGVLDNTFSSLFQEFDCADEFLMPIPEFPEQKPLTPLFPTLESSSV